MKKLGIRLFSAAAAAWLLTTAVLAAEMLVPVGRVIGLELQHDSVTVVAFDDAYPEVRTAGLQIGDEILTIDGKSVDSAEDVRRALNQSDGTVDLEVSRKGKQTSLHLEPVITREGPKLGVYLRQGITGIGTVTFYDPATGRFGTLGHGVQDGKGKLLDMTQGSAYPASIVSIQKGKAGQPGQIKGALSNSQLLGNLTGNTAQGVFGVAPSGWEGQAIPVAQWDEITTGPATVRCGLSDEEPRDYSVEILKIYPRTRSDDRSFLLRVTDPELLERTGGIVQGMSGSPIIQNGKLVGAVTHVLVNDPTTGYGIFIENMLDAAA